MFRQELGWNDSVQADRRQGLSLRPESPGRLPCRFYLLGNGGRDLRPPSWQETDSGFNPQPSGGSRPGTELQGVTSLQARRSRKERICEPIVLMENQTRKDPHTQGPPVAPRGPAVPGSGLSSPGSAAPTRWGHLSWEAWVQAETGPSRGAELGGDCPPDPLADAPLHADGGPKQRPAVPSLSEAGSTSRGGIQEELQSRGRFSQQLCSVGSDRPSSAPCPTVCYCAHACRMSHACGSLSMDPAPRPGAHASPTPTRCPSSTVQAGPRCAFPGT